MAIKFETIKEQIVIVLYDYMLTSDADSFWYSAASIREALATEISGAFFKRALDGLIEDEEVERGVGDPEGEPLNTPVFSLTQIGIEAAEQALVRRGWDLSEYQPSPTVDRIISRAGEPELHAQINKQLSDLAAEVRESNEVGEALGDEQEVISDEIDTAVVLTSKPQFRLQRLVAFIVPTLQFIANKFVGSALGEAAKQFVLFLLRLP